MLKDKNRYWFILLTILFVVYGRFFSTGPHVSTDLHFTYQTELLNQFSLPQAWGDSGAIGLGEYVKNVNGLMEDVNSLKSDSLKNARSLSELTRRFAFEWDGMRMHEYYFEALGGAGKPDGDVVKLIEAQFGSFEAWLEEFKTTGAMRGAGWVSLILDKRSGNLHNTWVTDHEIGHLAGADVLIAMDVWEHAFLIDYLPSERKEYIESYFRNLKWSVIEERLANATK